MNRINPIHIAILLIAILLFVLIELSSTKSELSEVKQEYKKSEQLSTKLVALKDAYSNKKDVKKSFQKILSLAQLKSAKIEQKVKKSSLYLSSKGMDKNALNLLMGKILNGAYNITSFKIKKLSQKSVSFEMEIAW